MFETGTGQADITAFKKGVGMMGYGMYYNTVEEIETPLSARAFVIRNPQTQKKIVFVNAEMCFITIAIKSEVLKKLQQSYPHYGYTMDNVMLTAQHTHSAPGGYSHYAFYNLSIPGFVPQVFEAIVNGIVEAIVKAESTVLSANIYLNSGSFAPEAEVAFNRSINAYNSNPEVQKVDETKAHLAVDREMVLLRIEGLNNTKIGAINWFGVHTTSIPNDNHKICYDNKGYAAAYFERDFRSNLLEPNFVAAFAQPPCGDVSPNFIWDKNKKRMRGKHENSFESARFNGNLQYLKAKEIYESALNNQPLKNDVDYVHTFIDFSNVKPDKEFTNGQEVSTGSACHGVAFFKGTAEGPGMSNALGVIARFLSRTVKVYELLKSNFLHAEQRAVIKNKYKIQGVKDILFETGEGKVLGTSNIKNLLIPSWADKSLGVFKQQYKNGALRKPWIPQILPLQLIIIGELAIASFPGEITTVAGHKLKKTIQNALSQKGIKRVIISCYANAYCGYVTTYEEYQCQQYEGGHTVFGQWTLAAFQTEFKKLALQLLERPEIRKNDACIQPVEFTKEELAKRSFPEN
jgi:neutral ceramidase